jgi:hypothetical protein
MEVPESSGKPYVVMGTRVPESVKREVDMLAKEKMWSSSQTLYVLITTGLKAFRKSKKQRRP